MSVRANAPLPWILELRTANNSGAFAVLPLDWDLDLVVVADFLLALFFVLLGMLVSCVGKGRIVAKFGLKICFLTALVRRSRQ
jgi:hypothetical protein